MEKYFPVEVVPAVSPLLAIYYVYLKYLIEVNWREETFVDSVSLAEIENNKLEKYAELIFRQSLSAS